METSNNVFRKIFLVVSRCGLGCFFTGFFCLISDKPFNYLTASSVGGQLVIPGMVAAFCGYTFYLIFNKWKLITCCLSTGLGWGLFLFFCSVLVQVPANVKYAPYVMDRPVFAFVSGLIIGFIQGIFLYFFVVKKQK